MRVVDGERVGGVGGFRERVGRDDRARDLGRAVDAVGVAGQRVDTGRAVKRDGEREAIFGVGPADAVAASGDGKFAAREQKDGFVALYLARKGGMFGGDVAGLAFEGVAGICTSIPSAFAISAAAASDCDGAA